MGSAVDQTTCANHLSRVANRGRAARPTTQMTQVSHAVGLSPEESMGAKERKSSHASEWLQDRSRITLTDDLTGVIDAVAGAGESPSKRAETHHPVGFSKSECQGCIATPERALTGDLPSLVDGPSDTPVSSGQGSNVAHVPR